MSYVFCFTADFRLSSLRSCKLMYGGICCDYCFLGGKNNVFVVLMGTFGLPRLQVN